jgi:MoaA/NifB/PqqE/SkfB family radical SAM enzyme
MPNVQPAISHLSYREKLINHAERIMHLKEFGFSYPSHFTIGLVTYCDQFCKGCYAGGYRFDPKIMFTASLDALKNTLRTASHFGDIFQNHAHYSQQTLGLKSVTLVGSGEPLLYPHLVPLLEFMEGELRLDVGIYTNGNNLADQVVREGIDAKPQDVATAILERCCFVRISLDAASAAIHAKERGAEGQFQRILGNIEALVARRARAGRNRPTIGIQFTVDDVNAHEIVAAAKLAKSLGVDYLNFKPKYVPWYMKKDRMTALGFEDVEASLLEAQQEADERFLVHGKFDQFRKTWGPQRTNSGEDYPICHGVWLSSYLDVDVHSPVKDQADLRVFICVNKDKEERNADGDYAWSVGPIDAGTDFEAFWRNRMPPMVHSVQVQKCVAGCKNDPYNSLAHQFLGLPEGDLERLKRDQPPVPASAHPNHI